MVGLFFCIIVIDFFLDMVISINSMLIVLVATHVYTHNSEKYNLSVAFRLLDTTH
jgi:hypothetical protein